MDQFCHDPDATRRYALTCDYVFPFSERTWLTSALKHLDSDADLRARFEEILDMRIDASHWAHGTKWNGKFHVKLQGDPGRIHNHTYDPSNGCGLEGWAAILFLSPDAPPDGGVSVWCSESEPDRDHTRYVLDPRCENWRLLATVDNIYNRLVLIPSQLYHSGAAGWAHTLDQARLVQTFFFRPRSRNGSRGVANGE